ncbi:MAG: PilZ domain-containing protein [Acidobacteriia bacterium]|nr:PilZ domain-containing protein [Terriglobia bacterium]
MGTESNERRAHGRFAMAAPMSYESLGSIGDSCRGEGRIVNLSSGGLLFQSRGTFRPGMTLEFHVPWPGPSGRVPRLRLRITGSVVRVDGSLIAVAITSYEFQAANQSLATGQ